VDDVLTLQLEYNFTEQEATQLLDAEFTLKTIQRIMAKGGRAALGLRPANQPQVGFLFFS